MVPLRERTAGFLPWSGLASAFLGLAIYHQWGSDGIFDDCGSYPPPAIGLILLVALLLAGLGALGSLSVARDDLDSVPRRFIAMVSVGAAALFCVAMILPFVASLLIPKCFA
jgi:hypothetical protein